MVKQMIKPIAILISDIHYSLPTLELADNAMRQAITKANELEVPLIVAGDLHDSKANLRGECVNRMIETFKLAKQRPYLIIGNHDLINEKSSEHALHFLERYTNIVHGIRLGASHTNMDNIVMIAYHSDPEKLREALSRISSSSTLIMHQGIEGSNSGDYIQDKSAISHKDVENFRVISGHYHQRQTIYTDDYMKKLRLGYMDMNGTWDYIGNPYTLNYGEASDLPKGYQILMSDGSLEFVPTNLRKHVIFNATIKQLKSLLCPKITRGDLLWVRLSGSKEELTQYTKKICSLYLPFDDFKLTLEPTDLDLKAPTKQLTQGELFDNLIDSIDTSPETKTRLKTTWKELYEG